MRSALLFARQAPLPSRHGSCLAPKPLLWHWLVPPISQSQSPDSHHQLRQSTSFRSTLLFSLSACVPLPRLDSSQVFSPATFAVESFRLYDSSRPSYQPTLASFESPNSFTLSHCRPIPAAYAVACLPLEQSCQRKCEVQEQGEHGAKRVKIFLMAVCAPTAGE